MDRLQLSIQLSARKFYSRIVTRDSHKQADTKKMDSKHKKQKESEEIPELIVHEEPSQSPLFQGKYEILQKLGTGGMGVVFKARDLTLDRFVAIKLLPERQCGDTHSLLRFQQEARAAGALSHDGIVGIHEFAISDNGQPYIAMDFVDGTSLCDLLSNGPLSVEKSLQILIGVTDALVYAHDRGVIHRDLKPANIMISTDEKQRQTIKIVDFGIAKLTTTDGKSLTQTGDVFGSPLYMSPEQCSGGKVDSRTDIYSLGCVLYEAVTGKPPHVGESALATAMMHLQQEPLPLSAAQPNLHFPNSLQSILDKALAKSVSDRYQTVSAFQSDLQKLQSGEVGQFTKISADQNHRRLLNSVKQRLSIFLGIVLLVGASFAGNLTVSGFLYLLGGLLLVFSIPGLRSNGPISEAMQRQGRTLIPISRGEMISWIVFVPVLIGVLYVFAHGGLR